MRTWGVKGLVRLATLPDVNSQLRMQIVDTLVSQLNSSGKEHKWYQWRLAEGLGKINVVQNQDKRPFVPQGLARVLTDTERPWLVRGEAAQSLGRLPYDSNIDVGLLAYEIAQLAQQMTDAFNKQPKLSIWKLCFMKVYGAFKPLEDDDSKQKGAACWRRSSLDLCLARIKGPFRNRSTLCCPWSSRWPVTQTPGR